MGLQRHAARVAAHLCQPRRKGGGGYALQRDGGAVTGKAGARIAAQAGAGGLHRALRLGCVGGVGGIGHELLGFHGQRLHGFQLCVELCVLGRSCKHGAHGGGQQQPPRQRGQHQRSGGADPLAFTRGQRLPARARLRQGRRAFGVSHGVHGRASVRSHRLSPSCVSW